MNFQSTAGSNSQRSVAAGSSLPTVGIQSLESTLISPASAATDSLSVMDDVLLVPLIFQHAKSDKMKIWQNCGNIIRAVVARMTITPFLNANLVSALRTFCIPGFVEGLGNSQKIERNPLRRLSGT